MTKQKEMKNKKKQFKKASGITLIALVITIVVLIILATVSINMILNDDGIIGSAEKSKELYQNAVSKEQVELGIIESELEDHLPKVDMVKSEDNQYVPVPKGYVASTIEGEKSVSTGFVIKKGDNGAATEGVNEFVWVPVSEESFNAMFATSTTGPIYLSGQSGEKGVKTEYYSNLRIRTGDSYTLTKPGTSGVREPDLLTDYDNDSYAVRAGYTNLSAMAQGLVNDYANMRESIKKYKGFYIGRYELTGSVENPTVQSGNVLDTDWYNLYKACRNVAKAGEEVTSTMIWGCQWDETMNWLKNTKFKDDPSLVDSNSSSWGNYSDYDNGIYASPQITGYNKQGWSANNICDLAGNYFEWTQEADYTDLRVCRGGYYDYTGSDIPASARYDGDSPDVNGSVYSARATLYVNP